ncbi:MAG: hypothetical protein WCG50_04105 [Rhodoferax sp.]|uniref:hypothetical protein n=1 Tax=Rhodoferax sp. TaxID=50421 RepID=UPI003017A38E
MTTRIARYPSGLNYAFRPTSYFQDLNPTTLIVSSILGEERRKDVQQRLAAGDSFAGEDWLTESKLEDSTRQIVGSLHPAYMGGEYLPSIANEEIEIARIVLASVTQDVISIRAKRTKKNISYRVVDEYDGVFVTTKKWSAQPLTLKQLIKFIDETYQEECDGEGGLVFSILGMNIDASGDAECMRGFVDVKSSFYPELGRYYALEIDSYLDGFLDDEDDADEPEGEQATTSFQATLQLRDLQNLPEDPALGAIRESDAAATRRRLGR